MARIFNGSSDYLEATQAVRTTVPVSIAALIYPDTIASFMAILSIDVNGGTHRYQLGLNVGKVQANVVDANTSGQDTSTTMSANTWASGLAVFAAVNSHYPYLNGGGKVVSTDSRSPTGLNRTTVGARWQTTLGAYWDGRIAELAVWDVALTDADALVLARGFQPCLVRPGNLVGYWPTLARVSPEVDLIGSVGLPVSGAVVGDHPRVFTPRRR